MNNKYYTPKIEEFHVGFEYESYEMYYRAGDEWDTGTPMWIKRTVLDVNQEQYTGEGHKYKAIYHVSINNKYETMVEWNKNIRVKYLDMEDLAELGFELIHFGLVGMDGKKDIDAAQFLFNNGRYFVHLELTRFSSWIVLRIDTSVSESGVQTNIVHSITINNKSELKVLMQQLNIL